MPQRKLILFMMTVGGIIGGYIPNLWGASMFSLQGILFSGLGGFLGIYAGYKMGE